MKLDNSLFMAAERGWYTVVRALMDLSENADSQDERDRTVFTSAVLGRDVNIVEHLIEKWSYPDFMDDQYRSPLSYASDKGCGCIVKKLLDDEKFSADSKDKDGQTPLWWVTTYGHADVVELLLKTDKVEVDAKDDYLGQY